MKHTLRYTAFTIVCLIIFSSTLIYIAPTSQAIPEPPDGDNAPLRQKFWAWILSFKWYNVGSGPKAKYFFADPDYIKLDYLGKN